MIRFIDVYKEYDNGTKALKGVSMRIDDGEFVFLVGPSGSGKSTITRLAARFWDVNKGSVKLGGIDVKDYSLDSLMSNFSMVFQNVYLFQDSVENNIKFGCPEATHEQVVAAAKAACCHDFIMALPNGYDTVIGEGGSTLSGGEKQRISIARALLKKPKVLILDNPTQGVDVGAKEEIYDIILRLAREGVAVVVLSSEAQEIIRVCDRALVLYHGALQGEVSGADMNEQTIMHLATGGAAPSAQAIHTEE